MLVELKNSWNRITKDPIPASGLSLIALRFNNNFEFNNNLDKKRQCRVDQKKQAL
jgi:hypothetical protein